MNSGTEADDDDLQTIIRASPVEPVDGYYYVSSCVKELDGIPFATLADGIERTSVIVTSRPSLAPRSDLRGPYRLLRLRVSRPFEAPGFLAAACAAIADQGCSVLIYSTFSFDYLLVPDHDFDTAYAALIRRGFGREPANVEVGS